ncbi:hypothetical protein ACFL2R_00560 [Patescibacteria group bacterium]
MKILDFTKKNRWFFYGILVLFWVIFINLFPDGFIIAGEDTAQLINLKHSFWDNLYEWQGRVSLFYGVFYLLDKVGVSETGQLSWYLGLFIFISYFSFHIFSKLIFRKSNNFIVTAVSIFYALNLYTLYVFTYSWGYSYYQILYAFVPLLVGLYIQFLKTEKNIFGAFFCLALFFVSPGFGNPAFAVSFLLLLMSLTGALLAFKQFELSRGLCRKFVIMVACSLFVSAYWIFPIVSQFKIGVGNLSGGNIIDLKWWIQHTSNSIMNILQLKQFNEARFFPANFPYVRFSYLKEVFVALTFIPVMILLVSLWQKKKKEWSGIYWSFMTVLVVFVMLTSKVRFPFEKINNFLYQLPGLNALRGYEKLAIFTPFIVAVILLIFFLQSQGRKYYKLTVVIFLMIIITPIPFFVGKLQQDTSFILANEKSKDYQRAGYSFLVKVPDEYYEIQDIINGDSEDVKIASLPHNVIGSIGWANYPMWKLQGNDVTQLLYEKDVISPNGLYFNQWLFAKDFNYLNLDPEWMAEMLGLLNVKYVIYHKDVEESFLEQSQDKIDYLERIGSIKRIVSNDYFDLYELDEKYRLPHVYLHDKNIELENNPLVIMDNFELVKEGVSVVDYKNVNPKKFEINLENGNSKYIILNEAYDSNWRAYFARDDGRVVDLEHVDFLKYSNGWKLKNSMKNGTIVIEYFSFKLFQWGACLSVISFVLISIYIILYFYGKRKR